MAVTFLITETRWTGCVSLDRAARRLGITARYFPPTGWGSGASPAMVEVELPAEQASELLAAWGAAAASHAECDAIFGSRSGNGLVVRVMGFPTPPALTALLRRRDQAEDARWEARERAVRLRDDAQASAEAWAVEAALAREAARLHAEAREGLRARDRAAEAAEAEVWARARELAAVKA